MKICVLQPDYAGSDIDYGNYDPRRDLSGWLPGEQVDHVFLRKTTSYRQILEASKKKYDIYINLCEGYPEWDVPGFDVIWSLERLNLPYTGTSLRTFIPSKVTMKIVAEASGVRVPPWRLIRSLAEVDGLPPSLSYPLFVKPADLGDSLGIDERSLVKNPQELRNKCEELLAEAANVLVEKYVGGREFTVLVAANHLDLAQPLCLTPFEFVFETAGAFKTYRLKVTEHHEASNVPVEDPPLATALRDMAGRIFRGFEAQSYARIDIRADAAGELYFLEINCECSIFYPEGYEGSADYILKHDPLGHSGFLQHIIAEGIARHRAAHPVFEVRATENGKLGCFAQRDLAAGEVVLAGEAQAFRLASTAEDFRKAFTSPALQGFHLLRDADPRKWAPFRCSPQANLLWRGLDLVTAEPVPKGQELTVTATN